MDTQLLPFATQDVPRYTSYPDGRAVPAGFSGRHGRPVAGALDPEATLSVYVHIPFCRQLCWYCGCHTSVPNSYDRAARYVDYLVKDIRRSAALFQGRKGKVTHLHFGGGTPTYLDDLHIGEIVEAIDKGFGLASGGEMALESDPRTLTKERARVLAGMGFNRISFGVQDFATPVQMKINRLQTYGLVAAANDFLREAGFTSVNFDLMYGLPAQTVESVAKTAEQAAGLRPDRISVFGYAHVPWFKKHQKMINDAELPGVRERYAQATTIERELNAHGYASIGLDHFALEHDELTAAARTGTHAPQFPGLHDGCLRCAPGLRRLRHRRIPPRLRAVRTRHAGMVAAHRPQRKPGHARPCHHGGRPHALRSDRAPDVRPQRRSRRHRHGATASTPSIFDDVAEKLEHAVPAGIATSPAPASASRRSTASSCAPSPRPSTRISCQPRTGTRRRSRPTLCSTLQVHKRSATPF